MESGFYMFLLTVALLGAPAFSDLVLSEVNQRIDLTTQIVRVTSFLKVENVGSDTELLLAVQGDHLAFFKAMQYVGKRLSTGSNIHPRKIYREGMDPSINFYLISLAKGLCKKEICYLETNAAYTHLLQPFPKKLTQADVQLVIFNYSAYYMSPYAVKFQTLNLKFPSSRVEPHPRIESFTRLEETKFDGWEITHGPFENISPFSYSTMAVHFENNEPFAVAQELMREIKISHRGNVQVIEHYKLIHAGVQLKGEFSRFEYQWNPTNREGEPTPRRRGGVSAFDELVAVLPPGAHSVYCSDAYGSLSTLVLGTAHKVKIKLRYPMFGGWKTSFNIEYSLPRQEYSASNRFLNMTFGCPMDDVVVDNLTVKVVLPEGSKDVSVSVPFSTNRSSLHVDGRPVVVLEMTNAVQEHTQYFQVYYKCSKNSKEPFMMMFRIFFLLVAVYVIHKLLSL